MSDGTYYSHSLSDYGFGYSEPVSKCVIMIKNYSGLATPFMSMEVFKTMEEAKRHVPSHYERVAEVRYVYKSNSIILTTADYHDR